jgi:hypothetical protein
MTPKEKALELVDNFNEYTVKAIKYYANGKMDECKEDAKECALIAAREIVDTLYEYHYDSASGAYEYWTEVKEELEAL